MGSLCRIFLYQRQIEKTTAVGDKLVWATCRTCLPWFKTLPLLEANQEDEEIGKAKAKPKLNDTPIFARLVSLCLVKGSDYSVVVCLEFYVSRDKRI